MKIFNVFEWIYTNDDRGSRYYPELRASFSKKKNAHKFVLHLKENDPLITCTINVGEIKDL